MMTLRSGLLALAALACAGPALASVSPDGARDASPILLAQNGEMRGDHEMRERHMMREHRMHGCRTTVIRRSTPGGMVTKRIRQCG